MPLNFVATHSPWDHPSSATGDFDGNSPNSVAHSEELGIYCVCGGETQSGVGGGAYVATSPDGVTWTKRTVAGATLPPIRFDHQMEDITRSDLVGLFVMIGYTNMTTAFGDPDGTKLWTSPDGINWTGRSLPAGFYLPNSVRWYDGPDIFIMTGTYDSPSATQTIATSTDGINWTVRTNPIAGSTIAEVDYSPTLGLFAGVTSTGSQIITSPDGITWTVRTSSISTVGSAIHWYPQHNRFYVTTQTTLDMWSSDGITWTTNSFDAFWWYRALDNYGDVYATQAGGYFSSANTFDDWDFADSNDINALIWPVGSVWASSRDEMVVAGARYSGIPLGYDGQLGGIIVSAPNPITGSVVSPNTAHGTLASNTVAEDVQWYFQWGTSAGTVSANSLATNNQGPGFSQVAVSQHLSFALTPGVTYYYRLVAIHRSAISYGDTLSFVAVEEPPPPPPDDPATVPGKYAIYHDGAWHLHPSMPI